MTEIKKQSTGYTPKEYNQWEPPVRTDEKRTTLTAMAGVAEDRTGYLNWAPQTGYVVVRENGENK